MFGDAGTTGQHAFFQMLHQGTDVIPVDIVAVAKGDEGPPDHQARLLANAIAQAEALMVGHANPHEPMRNFPGDRPTSFILLDRLTPAALGALIALYEHKVFVEGVLWGIDSFDQWGVELGKTLAKAGVRRAGRRRGRRARPVHHGADRAAEGLDPDPPTLKPVMAGRQSGHR